MIYLTGNSHLGAIRKGSLSVGNTIGASLFPLGSANFENEKFSARHGRQVRFKSDSLTEKLIRGIGSDSIESNNSWGFVIGTHNSPLYGDRFWNGTQFGSSRVIRRQITGDAMAQVIRSFLSPKLEFFRQLLEIDCNYFVISGPPPKISNPCFQSGIKPDTAIYIDNLLREFLESWLEERQIAFIPPPAECIGPDGFLLDEYCQNETPSGKPDPHHANSVYGEIMFDKIKTHVNTQMVESHSRVLDLVVS